MRSSVKLVLSGPTRQPAIRVKILPNDDDDIGDQVFQMFFEEFGDDLAIQWCKVVGARVNKDRPGEEKHLLISPIIPADFENEFYRFKAKFKEINSEKYSQWEDTLVMLRQPQPKRKHEKEGVSISHFQDNRIVSEVLSESNSYEDCSIAIISMVTQLLKSVASVPDHHQGRVFRALNDLIKNMPEICDLQSSNTGNNFLSKAKKTGTAEFPRKAMLEKNTPAELAIRAAIDAVEIAGADIRLTNAVIHLTNALNEVADFVDNKK